MKKILFPIILALFLAACGNGDNADDGSSAENGALEEITFVLDWTPNTNHTGIYAAQAEGYYEERGLDVNIVLPGEAGAEQTVATGNGDFGISAQENVTQARLQGVDIVSLAAIIQDNTSVLASPEEYGLETPSDLEGQTYGGYGSPIEEETIASIMQADGADISEVDILNIGDTDFFTAVQRDVDFAWIYYGWTGIEAELRDFPLNTIDFTEYSDALNFYTPVLMTNQNLIDSDPETVRAFTEATAEGYQFAMEQPEAAAEHLIEAEPDLDPELVRASQEWLVDVYQGDAPYWGYQAQDVWQNYSDWMYENELIESELDVEQAYTNEFLPGAE
ncbi:ABC transporter substrate-binding protein [Salinicoccus sp. ID82-1]|uniref:ABC transporter substrate-binding protein n=1 Tax=Salinicoccus sp. ID82-1 TaxID=2820269 RepID=UPI001F2AA357|nr:ABC transporter substrate-binding protein [Salinicoccus sp. ID82-1]MCG1009968.1 ABC transporter substrate-binding protein [Salinicoccus sp. ID82-1]